MCGARWIACDTVGCGVAAANTCALSQRPTAALGSRGGKMRRINWMESIGAIEAPAVGCGGH